jgi:hypothetical protein
VRIYHSASFYEYRSIAWNSISALTCDSRWSPQHDGETWILTFQRGRVDLSRFPRLGACVVATTIGFWLGARPLRRLFRVHMDIFARLAATAHNRDSSLALCAATGELAKFSARSVIVFCRCVVQRSRSHNGGSACGTLHSSQKAVAIKWVDGNTRCGSTQSQ